MPIFRVIPLSFPEKFDRDGQKDRQTYDPIYVPLFHLRYKKQKITYNTLNNFLDVWF